MSAEERCVVYIVGSASFSRLAFEIVNLGRSSKIHCVILLLHIPCTLLLSDIE